MFGDQIKAFIEGVEERVLSTLDTIPKMKQQGYGKKNLNDVMNVIN